MSTQWDEEGIKAFIARHREKEIRLDRTEQKSVFQKVDHVGKFSNPGEFVADLLSGTFATAKACLNISPHRRCVGLEAKADWFAASTEALMETNARGS